MDCSEVREHLLNAAQAGAPAAAGLDEHLRACGACAAELASLRATMSLLDEWPAPEPSAYFDQRLRVRLRELQREPRGWLAWLRKPAVALALAGLMIASVSLFRSAPPVNPNVATQPTPVAAGTVAHAEENGAVEDLQQLEDDEDLYANFDLLDEIAAEQEVSR